MAAAWKPPRAAEEVVPARCLSTSDVPEVFVLQTPLPADDRSAGYGAGTSVSKQWEQAITDAAIEVAGHVASRFRRQGNMADESLGHDAKTRAFLPPVRRTGLSPAVDGLPAAALYRPPLPARARSRNGGPPRGIVRTHLAAVPLCAERRSPASRREPDGADHVGLAARRRLAAGRGERPPEDGPAASRAARRMLADPRAASKLRLFFLQWMKVETPPDLAKDPKSYASFDAAIAADLRTSLKLFVNSVMWGKASDFRQLLLADDTYLNGRLAEYYGVKLPHDADFQEVAFEPEQRAGISRIRT